MKITGNENSVWNLQRDELLQCWNFREFISWILCNMSIASGKKKDKVSIAIAPSNFTFFSLFLVYQKGLFYVLYSFQFTLKT